MLFSSNTDSVTKVYTIQISCSNLPDTKCRPQTRVLGYFSGPRSHLCIRASQKSRRFWLSSSAFFPLVAYNCWQTVKTDALSLFRGVGTANYSTNNHLPISQQFTQHEYFTQYGSEYLHLVYQYAGRYHVHIV